MRPLKKTNALMEKIIELRESGYSDTSIAKQCDISRLTLIRWKNEDKEFRAKLDSANERKLEMLGDIAEESIIKQITGYYVDEEEVTECSTLKGVTMPNLKTKRIKRYIPPNVGAIIFVLTNRFPDRWKNKLSHEPLPPAPAPEELAREIKELIAENGFHEFEEKN